MTNKEDSSLICIKNLSFSYSEIMALENIDVTIPANSMTALVGPDGVGKSTLLSLLAGVRKIQTGTIEVFNNDISKKQFEKRIIHVLPICHKDWEKIFI